MNKVRYEAGSAEFVKIRMTDTMFVLELSFSKSCIWYGYWPWAVSAKNVMMGKPVSDLGRCCSFGASGVTWTVSHCLNDDKHRGTNEQLSVLSQDVWGSVFAVVSKTFSSVTSTCIYFSKSTAALLCRHMTQIVIRVLLLSTPSASWTMTSALIHKMAWLQGCTTRNLTNIFVFLLA